MEKGDRKIKDKHSNPSTLSSCLSSPSILRFPVSWSPFSLPPVSLLLPPFSVTEAYYRVFSLVCPHSYSYTFPEISIAVLWFP